MVRLIFRQRGGLASLKLTKLFGIDDFQAAKDSGKVLIIIIYCYLIIIIDYLMLFHIRISFNKSLSNRPFYSCLFSNLAFHGSMAAGGLILINSSCVCCVN